MILDTVHFFDGGGVADSAIASTYLTLRQAL